jgi:hypothetical protein
MDLVLVDASQEYDYLRSDTEQAMKMLQELRVILWHDYPRAPRVARYIGEIARDIPIYRLAGTCLALYRALS